VFRRIVAAECCVRPAVEWRIRWCIAASSGSRVDKTTECIAAFRHALAWVLGLALETTVNASLVALAASIGRIASPGAFLDILLDGVALLATGALPWVVGVAESAVQRDGRVAKCLLALFGLVEVGAHLASSALGPAE
jgi:hypothetical protein